MGCHCTLCQRWTGGAGLTRVVAARKNFNVTKGQYRQYLIKQYCEGGVRGRYFCSNCGSSLFTDDGEKYYVGAGTLEGVTLGLPYHYQVAFKAPWDTIGDSGTQYLRVAS